MTLVLSRRPHVEYRGTLWVWICFLAWIQTQVPVNNRLAHSAETWWCLHHLPHCLRPWGSSIVVCVPSCPSPFVGPLARCLKMSTTITVANVFGPLMYFCLLFLLHPAPFSPAETKPSARYGKPWSVTMNNGRSGRTFWSWAPTSGSLLKPSRRTIAWWTSGKTLRTSR